MKKDIPVTGSSGNAFADIGLSNPEEHLLKADIALLIGKTIQQRNLTQTAAAELIGLSQPDVSNLLRGRFRGFSLERLLGFLVKLGHNVTIAVEPANRNTPEGRLRLAHA